MTRVNFIFKSSSILALLVHHFVFALLGCQLTGLTHAPQRFTSMLLPPTTTCEGGEATWLTDLSYGLGYKSNPHCPCHAPNAYPRPYRVAQFSHACTSIFWPMLCLVSPVSSSVAIMVYAILAVLWIQDMIISVFTSLPLWPGACSNPSGPGTTIITLFRTPDLPHLQSLYGYIPRVPR